VVVAEHKLFELLKRVQNRQYDDQRGTSLNAFKEMPDFLRLPGDDGTLAGKIADEREKNEDLNIEICRRDVSDNDDCGGQLAVSPSRVCTQDLCDELDSIIPSNDNAERYFSQIEWSSSPDFNDSRLMEGSLCDIGMDSTSKTKPRNGWSLVGSIASNPSATRTTDSSPRFSFSEAAELLDSFHHKKASQAVCSLQDSNARVHMTPSADADSAEDRNRTFNVAIANRHLNSSCSTPSPTTHDLLFENGECVVSKVLPKNEQLEDCDLVYGIV
jgi:hypothetical protein